MKTINLNDFSVDELNEKEMQDVRGGFIPFAVAVAIILSVIDNFDDIRHGLKDGWNGKPRYLD